MEKQKQQLLILVSLMRVLVIALANAFMPKKKKPAPASSPASDASPLLAPIPVPPVVVKTNNDAVSAKATADELMAQQQHADKPWGVDPFFHVVDKEVYQGSGLVLKGVSIGEGRRRYATINTEIVTIGDTIYGYRVEEIDKTKVLLKRGAESYYLVWNE